MALVPFRRRFFAGIGPADQAAGRLPDDGADGAHGDRGRREDFDFVAHLTKRIRPVRGRSGSELNAVHLR